jgi:uncharacterized protein
MSPTSAKSSLSVRLLSWLARSVYNHRRWFFYPQALLVVVCLYYTATHLQFHTNRNDLVGSDKRYHRIFMEFRKEFPVADDLVVVVESPDLEKNRQFVERLGEKLKNETNLFSSVFYKADLNLLGPKALLFMPLESLKELDQTLKSFLPMFKQFSQATNLVSLFDLVNTQIRRAKAEENEENRTLVAALPALERILSLAADALTRPGVPPSPGIYSLFEAGKEATKQVYVTFDNGLIFLLTAQARENDLQEEAVKRLRTLMEETQMEVPGINVGLTGEPVLELDEMDQSKRDTMLATVISLVMVALIFIYGYDETGRPLKATACLMVGLAYTMGFTTLTVGHLNILTITFLPILVGLAIDFGVHLITRYEEELWHGKSERLALEKALVNTGTGIFTGAFTTAGAFFAMAATDFKGIREMGIICGGGMFVCLVAMMTLLPVLLLTGKQNVLDQELGPVLDKKSTAEMDRRARLENVWLRRPGIVVGVILTLCALAIVPAGKVRFDYNLLNMQTEGLPSVIFQDKLIQTSPKSVLFAAVVADSAQAATNLAAALTNLSSVASIDSMSFILTEDQTAKLEVLRQVKKTVSEVHFHPLDTGLLNVSDLSQTLWSLHGYIGLALEEVSPSEDDLHRNLASLQKTIAHLLMELRMTDPEATSIKLAEYQRALFTDVREMFKALGHQKDDGPIRVEDLPADLRNRFVGVTGKHLLLVYPRKNVWERENQEEFIRQLRSVQPKVTGTPVQLYEYVTLLKDSYENAAVYSLSAIALLILIHFRKLSCVLLALLPVAVGSLWTLGIMGLEGVPFNPANIMTLPLIIGIGVTNGIHILNRFAEERHPSILARSTGKAVLVSGLTTIAGFGSLTLAGHRGIQSLGFVMSVGVAACMIVALTFLPAILNLLNRYGWSIKKTQCDNAQSTLGREEPR